MKKFFFLLVAAIIVGFACFAILKWIFKVDYHQSLNLAIVVGATGILIEYIKPLLSNKRQQN